MGLYPVMTMAWMWEAFAFWSMSAFSIFGLNIKIIMSGIEHAVPYSWRSRSRDPNCDLKLVQRYNGLRLRYSILVLVSACQPPTILKHVVIHI